MNNKKVYIIIAVLILVTGMLAAVHLATRPTEKENSVLLNGRDVAISSLRLQPVVGTTINGKGEEKQIDAQGIPVAQLCGENFSVITVTAADEYSARILPEDADNAHLIVTEDGSLRLVVFGDTNSKRDVKHVVRIEVQP